MGKTWRLLLGILIVVIGPVALLIAALAFIVNERFPRSAIIWHFLVGTFQGRLISLGTFGVLMGLLLRPLITRLSRVEVSPETFGSGMFIVADTATRVWRTAVQPAWREWWPFFVAGSIVFLIALLYFTRPKYHSMGTNEEPDPDTHEPVQWGAESDRRLIEELGYKQDEVIIIPPDIIIPIQDFEQGIGLHPDVIIPIEVQVVLHDCRPQRIQYILNLLAKGYTYEKVGEELGISGNAVGDNVKKFCEALGHEEDASFAVQKAREYELVTTSTPGGQPSEALTTEESPAHTVPEATPTKSEPAEWRNSHHLTQRETDVLRLVAEGKSNPEIAEELKITRHTVTSHMQKLYDKIGIRIRDRVGLAHYAQTHHLTNQPEDEGEAPPR